MTGSVQISNRVERALVRLADVVLSPLLLAARARTPAAVSRVLLLRLERIGDLLMTVDAIRQARATWPDAEIDLAIGEWNRPLAALIPDIARLDIVSVPWLARGSGGDTWPALIAKARSWRARRYDVAINFEPDIRSNLLLWWSAATVRAGYSSGGGRAFLTSHAVYDQRAHVSTNACALVARTAALTGSTAAAPDLERGPRLVVPEAARARAQAGFAATSRPLVGLHVSGGRESKQWHLDRFAEVARRLVAERAGTIILTGAPADREMAKAVEEQLAARLLNRSGGPAVINAAGSTNLVDLAALLASLDVLITSDTGPMHLAAAVGTPVVALFGPSDPARYGPRARAERVLFAADVPCRPCGQVRLPPPRCRGHVPDCMSGIAVEDVVAAARDLLDQRRSTSGHPVPA